MLERMLAAPGGTKRTGPARVSAVPAHCSRAASLGGCSRAGGRAGGHGDRGSRHPDHMVDRCVPSHDVWAGYHVVLAALAHQVPGTS